MTASTLQPVKNQPRTPKQVRKEKMALTFADLEALPVFDPREVAQYLRIDSGSVYRAIKGGELPVENHGSGSRPVYRISREALAHWRASRLVTPVGLGRK